MLTYQDLLAVGDDDRERADFCRKAVEAFRQSPQYKEAVDGESYYRKHNITIENYQKMLYTISGRKVPDLFSANYQLKTTFFRRLVIQQIQYVLGNGCVFKKTDTKEKLGKDFDFQLQNVAKRAMASGRAFGYWNLDHLEVFGYVDTPTMPGFCPLYDVFTSEIGAGIRFYTARLGNQDTQFYTLYEPDGYTEYRKVGSSDYEVAEPKQAYIKTEISTPALGVEGVVGSGYGRIPIVELFANDSHESELVGIRECLDAYDLVKSGFCNNIDDSSEFYWLVKNAGGMKDRDLAQLVQRIKTVHAAVVDSEDGGSLESHTIDIPVEARDKMLEILRKDIYDDFQSLDVDALSAAQKTTQEIQAAYQNMDNKCADFEYFVIDFVQKILALAGIDDNPTFVWNRVVNQKEITEMILGASQYLSDECVIKHLPFLTPEEAMEEIDKRKDMEYQSFNATDEEDEE